MREVLSSIIKYILTSIIAIAVYIEATKPIPFDYKPLEIPNGCLVDSLVFSSATKASYSLHHVGVWSEVICFSYMDQRYAQHGHAICVFIFNHKYYVYDPNGGTFSMLTNDRLDRRLEAVARTLPENASVVTITSIISPD